MSERDSPDTEPVAAVIVVASPPRLTEFDPEVFEGPVDAEVDGQETIDVYFCIRITSVGDPTDPTDPNLVTTREEGTDEGVIGTLDDPPTIPTGGGHSGRTALALVAFVILELTASTSLFVRSRTG